MAFKDNWRPRIDNVDDADVSAVNEIAEAVINNEENIKTINEKTYSKQEANTLFSNALKGTAVGDAVRIDDISPIAHEMAVKVSGVNDVSVIKVQRYGKNLFENDTSKLVPCVGGDGSNRLGYEFYLPTGTYVATAENKGQQNYIYSFIKRIIVLLIS